MKRLILLGVWVILACSLSGCSDNYAKHEAIGNEMVKALNDLADALESVKDKASAKAAATKINEICDRIAEIGKRASALPKVTQSDDNKLKAKFEPELKKVSDRLAQVALKAGAASGGDPDFLNSLKRLEQVGKDMQKLGGT
jgi:uncharacterized membrane-anchored protein YjiN (DUF445 family)